MESEAKEGLSLPPDHGYIMGELQDMAEQLAMERRLIGEATSWILLKEMWTIAGNRKRALISIGLMICQQMTGTNTLVSGKSEMSHPLFSVLSTDLSSYPTTELLCTADIHKHGSSRGEGLAIRYRDLRRRK